MFYYWVSASLCCASAYLTWRLVWRSRMRRTYKALSALLLFLLACVPALVTKMQYLDVSPFKEDRFYWLMYVVLGYMSMLTLAQVARDLVSLTRRCAWSLRGAPACALDTAAGQDLATAPVPARRVFLTDMANLGVLGASGVLTGCGMAQAWGRPEIVEVEVPIANLHPDLDGFTIAQLTDVHIGPTIKRKECADVVRQCNDLKADCIVVTGDVVDGRVQTLERDLEPLADLSARYGVHCVTGNHEYYSGAAHWVDLLRSMGHQMLLNEHRMLRVGGAVLCMAGVNDVQGGWYLEDHWTSPEGALKDAGKRDATIMLAHHPHSIIDVSKLDVDLQLSGHTHGGQYFPGNLLARVTQGYVAGLYRHDASWLYVSRGTGYWGPPIRLGVPPEMTLVRLRRMAA